MRVKLEKKILLKSASAFLSFRKTTKRPDIQDYLSGKKYPDPIVNARVDEYLADLDRKGCLMVDGQSVQESGLVWAQEAGKYRIWYSEDDSFFGNAIFCLEREEPVWWAESAPILRLEPENRVLLSTRNGKESGFAIIYLDADIAEQVAGECWPTEDILSFTWRWTNLENSEYFYCGQIKGMRCSIDVDSRPEPVCCVDFEGKPLSLVISDILPDWQQSNRLAMKLDGVRPDEQALGDFKLKNYRTEWRDFNVFFEDVPIEPFDDEVAREWRNLLLNRQLETAYLHPHDFTKNVKGLNAATGFTRYAEELDVPDVEGYREEVEPSNVSQRGRVFWHVAAPSDLCPA